jgi:hypothetical protein
MFKITRPLIALNEMVLHTLEVQRSDNCKNQKRMLSPLAFAKEICTIKFCLPRQSGHTTCALYLAKQHFVSSMFVAYNVQQLNGIKIISSDIGASNRYVSALDIENTIHFSTKNTIFNGKWRGIMLDAIIIDCASLYTPAKKELIYEEFLPTMSSRDTFIFLFLE